MERLQRAAVLLALVEKLRNRGDWCGETHIQKTTYFLQELMNVPLGFDFILYKHGPFSFDLSDEITAMRADNLFKLQPQPYPYGPSILPGLGSETLKENFQKTISQYDGQLNYVAEKFGGKTVAELERLATAFYVTSEQATPVNVEERSKRINELKPHISLDEARDAVLTVDRFIREVETLLSG
ncbi:MAG: hypothetical protein ACM3YE_01325 [Bacteroidota bacterium]